MVTPKGKYKLFNLDFYYFKLKMYYFIIEGITRWKISKQEHCMYLCIIYLPTVKYIYIEHISIYIYNIILYIYLSIYIYIYIPDQPYQPKKSENWISKYKYLFLCTYFIELIILRFIHKKSPHLKKSFLAIFPPA